MDSNASNLPQTCEEHKSMLFENLEPYQILSYIVAPLGENVWVERDDAWNICFFVYIAVMSAVFLKLGIVSVIMLIKKDCVRLPTKTFFAIYLSIAILGFSRALHLILDPLGLLGYIAEHFPAWFVLSRMLAIFGLPSLVASTTLLIFTILKVAKAVPGKQWYHYWKFIIPIMLTPYMIGFFSEIVANFTPYPGLLIVIVCFLFFALWGLVICLTFLFAGNRLLRQLRLRGRKTIRFSTVRANGTDMESQTAIRRNFASREQLRHQIRNRRTYRKITIITYGTALFTISYSLLFIATAIMIGIMLFQECFGFNGLAYPSVWLALEFCKRFNEIILSMMLLYSITDIAGVLRVLFGKCCTGQQVENSTRPIKNFQKNASLTTLSALDQPHVNESIESLSSNVNQGVLVIRTSTTDQSDDFNHENHNQDLADDIEPTVTSEHNETRNSILHPIQNHLEPLNPLNRASFTPEIKAPDEIIEDERRERKSTRHKKYSKTSKQKSIATQTVQIVVQIEPTSLEQSKPIPKPRHLKVKSKNQILNEQRIAALRQPSHALTSTQNHISRKRTI